MNLLRDLLEALILSVWVAGLSPLASTQQAALIMAAAVFSLAFVSVGLLKETFSRDLDFLET